MYRRTTSLAGPTRPPVAQRSARDIYQMTITATVSPIIYGPFTTQRLARTLTIDLCAARNHMVVSKDSTLPRSSLVVTTAATRIIELSKAGEKVKSIVIIGSSADPTEHPDLREASENFRTLCNKWFPRAKLYIQSNCANIGAVDVRAALSIYDRILARFEWGTTKTYSALTGGKSTDFAVLVKDLHYFDNLIVMASIYRGDQDNSTDNEVKAWIKRLAEIKPNSIQILKGLPFNPKERKLRAAPTGTIKKIVDLIGEETGLAVSVHDDENLMR